MEGREGADAPGLCLRRLNKLLKGYDGVSAGPAASAIDYAPSARNLSPNDSCRPEQPPGEQGRRSSEYTNKTP